MSLTLLKWDLKAHYKLWLSVAALLTMYFVVIVGMYDPQDADALQRLAGMKLSPELLRAFGFSSVAPGLTSFLSSYLYGFLMLAFPLVYSAIMGNRLVAALVDKGSMASILAAPISRVKVALTQACYLLCSLTALILWAGLVGLVYSQVRFPGLLDVPNYLRMNLHLILVQAAISGICFFASCLFSLSSSSLALGAGLPAIFLLAQMLINAGPKLSWLKYGTLFSLYKATDIAAGMGAGAAPFILLAITALLYGGGIYVFHRKDLPI